MSLKTISTKNVFHFFVILIISYRIHVRTCIVSSSSYFYGEPAAAVMTFLVDMFGWCDGSKTLVLENVKREKKKLFLCCVHACVHPRISGFYDYHNFHLYVFFSLHLCLYDRTSIMNDKRESIFGAALWLILSRAIGVEKKKKRSKWVEVKMSIGCYLVTFDTPMLIIIQLIVIYLVGHQ